MNNNYGLTAEHLRQISAVIKDKQEVDEAIIFGSRAKGNYKRGSDVDIALKGEYITESTISDISYVLNEETFMPYQFDILNYSTIRSKDLLSHIVRVGKTFYRKETTLHM